MINALVVDDERLVRQGLQTLTNWNKFNITFIGEAKDGIQALKFLLEQAVDVMFVDITMPNMNGFELMRHVQERHPHVKCVILTCHHDFDYVQEALQLGAIDYIVKTLLNRDNIEETAKRIALRLEREREARQLASTFSGGLYLYHFTQNMRNATKLSNDALEQAEELDRYWLRLPRGFTLDEITALDQDVALLQLSASKTVTLEEVERWLVDQGKRLLFYYGNNDRQLRLSDAQLIDCMKELEILSKEQEQRFIQLTESYLWLLYPQQWSIWVEELLRLKPNPDFLQQLCDHFYRQVFLTMSIGRQEQDGFMLKEPQLISWKSTEQWLQQFSILLRTKMGDLSFSHEVMLCMIKAIRYMHQQIRLELNQNELAYQVGMSRSYFSQCFKRFFGVPFGDVLRMLRLNAAKQLLVTTQISISDIAHRVGFVDHKYFSRAFKAQLGVYPTEYRSLHTEEMRGYGQ